MKKALLFIVCILIAVGVWACVAARDAAPITVTLNGEVIDCESYGSPATIVEGRTLVPLRAIFEALGASVEWDNSTKTVTSKLGGTEIKLTVGEKVLYKNGEKVTLDVPASIINDRTMVPARAIAESYGVKVEWDAKTRTVILTKEAASLATLVERKSDEADIPKITVYRATASAQKDEDGKVYGLFKGMNISTPETDYFINYIAKADVMDKDVVMSIKVKPNDTIKDIVFATGAHIHCSEAINMQMLNPGVWNKLTLVYKPSESVFELYINDTLKSSKSMAAQNNTFRILFRYADKIGDSYIEFDDYTVYSGKVAIPAVTSEKYTIDNLIIGGYGEAAVSDILENVTPAIDSYTLTITDSEGNIMKENEKVTDNCIVSVYDGNVCVGEYSLGAGKFKFEDAKVAAGRYILPHQKFSTGKMTFSANYHNYIDRIDILTVATQYDNNGKEIGKASNRQRTLRNGKAQVELEVTKAEGTYIEFEVFNADTNEQLLQPIRFEPYSSETIEFASPLYEGYTSKAVCFNYDDAVWQDTILVEYLNKYGIKCTFNLQGSNILTNVGARSGKTDDEGRFEFVKNLYAGHEISNHSMTHIPACFDEGEIGHSSNGTKLVGRSFEELIKDTLDCPAYIKEHLGADAIGIAWPQGYASQRSDYKTKILPAIQNAGLKYARAAENGSFKLPEDWYEWHATCHHRDAVKYTDMFIALENSGELKCFFNWGHSYEFENNKNNPDLGWTMIEGVMQKLAAEEDIWKATNGDIYRYVEATKLVEVTEKTVKNNSDMTVYYNVNGQNVEIKPGKTYTIG